MARPPRLDGSVVTVHGATTGPYGVGFLCAGDAVITCAHVVCQALGLPPDHPDPPDEPVTLEFLLLDGSPRVTAHVTTWRKPDDIAVLRLEPPAGAEPVRLVTADELWDHRVAAFGVPHNHEKDGAWATGELRGHRAGGLIQVDDDRPESGFTIQQGFSGSPVWDEEVGGVVGMVISASQRRKFACIVPTATLLDVLPPAGLPATPYRGLLSFREEDAELYFGRDALADTLAEDVRTRRVTVVVGPSGYGKSSLVAAGVLPRLRKRPELAVAGPIRPRGNPANEIAGALVELLQPEATPTQQLADRPTMVKMITEGRLDEVVGTLLDRNGADELLLIIDQLEEALDRGSVAALSPVIRGAFTPSSRLRLLLVIRADFLDRALTRPELAEGLREAAAVGAMTREQLHAAITGPLREGVTFETGLDQQIVAEVATAPGQLPLLQSVLDQLWQRQEGGRLTHRAYSDLGGVSGALARYAEEKGWAELSPEDRAVARRLFLRLVRVDPDLPTTRRPARRTQMSEQEWQLAQRLVNARLLVSGRRETVELAHEALISHWDRLRDWIEQDAEFRAWQDSVREQAASAEANTIKPKEMLRHNELSQAVHWQRTRPHDLSAGEHRLIRRSRRRRWTRFVQPAMAFAFVAVLASSWFGQWPHLFDLVQNPAEQLAVTLSGEPITDATLLRTIAAYDTDPGNEYTRRELFDRYTETRQVSAVLTDPRQDVEIDAVAASADGHVVVTRFATGATLWRESGRGMVPTALKVSAPDDVAVTADGTLVVVTGREGVWLFNDRGQPTGGFGVPHQKESTSRLTVAVAGRVIATRRGDEPVVRLWEPSGRRLRELSVGAGPGLRMWFAGGGRTLVTRTAEHGEVRTWDVATGASRRVTDTSQAAVVNPAGDTLVTCQVLDTKPLVRIHELTGPDQVADLPWDSGVSCDHMTIDLSGRYLGVLAAYEVDVYDMAEQRFVVAFQQPDEAPREPAAPALVSGPQGIQAVQPAGRSVLIYTLPFDRLETYPYKPDTGALSRDGRYLATTMNFTNGAYVALWDGRTSRRVTEVPAPPNTDAIEFDASGRYLVVSYSDGHDVEVRAVPSLEVLHSMPFPVNDNLAPPEIHLDARGHLLASHAGSIRGWDLATGERVGQPIPAETPESWQGTTVFAVAPDGRQLVVVSQNRHALDVWDLTTNRSRRVPVAGVAVNGVVATPWPGRMLVLRQADKDSSVLELWDLRASTPASKELLKNLPNDYTAAALRHSIGFDGDRIIRADTGEIHTWNSSGDDHILVVETFTSFRAIAVRGRTILSSGAHTVLPEPDRWRDGLCDLLGWPQDAPDMPDGINTTNLCPRPLPAQR